MDLDEEKTFLDGKITVKRRSDDYVAYATNYPRQWESGNSIAEAIGKLVISLSI